MSSGSIRFFARWLVLAFRPSPWHTAPVDALHLAHLGLLCAWAGTLLAEFVIESLGGDLPTQQLAARAHFWIDVLIELPLIAGVLFTGSLLLAHAWPPSFHLIIKIAAALVAISLNLYCCAVVVKRYQRRDDAAALAVLGRRVRLSVIGLPFGVAAAYMGFVYFMP